MSIRSGAGEWQQLQPLFPELSGKTVLDLGCGYGWHCKFAADHGAASVLGIDQSGQMIGEAKRRNPDTIIEYQVCGGLLRCGFVIEAVEEAMPPEPWRDQMPEEVKRPMMLLVRAGKQ
jgi:SAM-dependent methyltransferase